jgi:hypothetical protein
LSNALERVAAGAQVKKVWLGKGHSSPARANLAKLNDLFRVWIRQRPQQHTIDDAEDGSRRSDSKCERQNRNGRKARTFQKTANANANVFQ